MIARKSRELVSERTGARPLLRPLYCHPLQVVSAMSTHSQAKSTFLKNDNCSSVLEHQILDSSPSSAVITQLNYASLALPSWICD